MSKRFTWTQEKISIYVVIFWSYTNAESHIYVQKLIKNDTKVYMLSNKGHKVPTKKLPPFTPNNTHWNREIITGMSSMAFYLRIYYRYFWQHAERFRPCILPGRRGHSFQISHLSYTLILILFPSSKLGVWRKRLLWF